MRQKKTDRETKEREYSFREYCILYPLCVPEEQARLTELMQHAQRPESIAGVSVPKDLNLVSYGMLDDLANLSKGGNAAVVDCIARLLDVDAMDIYNANVYDVFGVAFWMAREVARINALFQGIEPKYSAEEVQAGVRSLNFGSFGVLDWYAHRQGIADQNAVRDVAWIRIYTCMKNDNARTEYEKRLNRVYSQKYKQNGKRK